MKKFLTITILFIFLFYNFFILNKAFAFTPEIIITDSEMNDYNSMDQNEIYNFLNRKKSFLANYKPNNIEYASTIIYNSSQQYKINPKVILTLLQKEQSLIENSLPNNYSLDWAMGYGMCDSCTRNTPGIDKFIGFENQVKMASKRLREYMDNKNSFTYKVNEESLIDGVAIKFLSQATASLYNYTPHIHGNKNFWKIWQRWFIKSIPNGSLVKLPNEPNIWLIKYGQKHLIKNMSVLISKYDYTKIIEVLPSDLEKYENGNDIKFHDYSLLIDINKKIYLLVEEDILRQIESTDIFKKLGYNKEELIQITKEDLNTFRIGEPITIKSIYPQGALVKIKNEKGVYFIKDGYKYPLIDEILLKTNFKNYQIIDITKIELNKFETKQPILLQDGEIVKTKNNSSVYVIDEGTKRPILNANSFQKNGYNWKNIKIVSQKLLDIHPLGKTID